MNAIKGTKAGIDGLLFIKNIYERLHADTMWFNFGHLMLHKEHENQTDRVKLRALITY